MNDIKKPIHDGALHQASLGSAFRFHDSSFTGNIDHDVKTMIAFGKLGWLHGELQTNEVVGNSDLSIQYCGSDIQDVLRTICDSDLNELETKAEEDNIVQKRLGDASTFCGDWAQGDVVVITRAHKQEPMGEVLQTQLKKDKRNKNRRVVYTGFFDPNATVVQELSMELLPALCRSAGGNNEEENKSE